MRVFSVSSPPKMSNDVLQKTLSGSGYLFILQLFSKTTTFALNLLLYKTTSPYAIGSINILLEPTYNAILFLSRENIRMTLLRNDSKNNNFTLLPLLFGAILSIIAAIYFQENPYYYTILVYLVSALLELFTEPFFNYFNNVKLEYKIRAKIEGASLMMKSLTTFILVFYMYLSSGDGIEDALFVFANGVGQFIGSLALVIGYFWGFYKYDDKTVDVKDLLLPRKIRQGHKIYYYFDPYLKKMAFTFFFQSAVKHVLTEGDKILLLWLSSAKDQGVYSFAANLGSLVARIVFQPLEETMRMFFSRCFVIVNGKQVKNEDSIKSSYTILQQFITLHLLFGSFFIFIAPNYTSALIDLLLGPSWSKDTSAAKVLSWYCIYVPVMGVNGISESCFTGLVKVDGLRKQSVAMVFFSVIYFLATWVSVEFIFDDGVCGFVLGNIVNLLVRIWFSMGFNLATLSPSITTVKWESTWNIIKFFRSSLPKVKVLIGFILSWIITRYSSLYFGFDGMTAKFQHIGVGVLVSMIMILLIVRYEKDLFQKLSNFKELKRKE